MLKNNCRKKNSVVERKARRMSMKTSRICLNSESCAFEDSTAWFCVDAAMCEVAGVTNRVRWRLRRWIKQLYSSRTQVSDSWWFFFLSRVADCLFRLWILYSSFLLSACQPQKHMWSPNISPTFVAVKNFVILPAMYCWQEDKVKASHTFRSCWKTLGRSWRIILSNVFWQKYLLVQ